MSALYFREHQELLSMKENRMQLKSYPQYGKIYGSNPQRAVLDHTQIQVRIFFLCNFFLYNLIYFPFLKPSRHSHTFVRVEATRALYIKSRNNWFTLQLDD